MKRVLLLATGDTIAYRPTRGSVATGAELLAAAGELPVRVTVEDVMAEPGWDISVGTQLTVARRVQKALREDGFDGVVVTHGVDNLEETAFLTDLMVTARGGIVFTGAFRYLDDPLTDGPRNLADALVAAADPRLANVGAVVCFDGELHAARWVTLNERFSAEPKLDLTAPPPRWPHPKGEPETDVALIKTYPGMDSTIINAVVDAGARGVVLEGTGAGSVPVELFATIGGMSGWDIPFVIASRARTPAGASLGADLVAQIGGISARGLPPGHARIAVMVALGGGGVAAVREWFDRL